MSVLRQRLGLCAAVSCLGLGALLSTGCAADREPVGASRLIEEDPQEVFRSAEVATETEVFRWEFAHREDLEPWRFGQDQGLAGIGPGGLLLAAGDRQTSLSRAWGRDADEVDLLALEIEGSRWGSIRLVWLAAGEGQQWRGVAAEPGERRRWEGSTNVYRFALAGHPHWQGEIARIGLALRHLPHGFRVVSLRGLRLAVDGDRLAAAATRPIKAAIGNDLRNARLAVPGVPIDWSLRPPRDSSLRFAYAVPESLALAVRFRVTGGREGQPRRLLFEAEVAPGSARPTGVWHPAEVDLAELAGTPLELSFETEAARSPSLAEGFPLWANPEVVRAAGRGDDRPAVILVSLDTLRADRLSLYGNPRPTSPELDRWAASSAVTFRQAVVQAPWTLPSHVSMLSGLEAFRHGVNFNGVAADEVVMLAERLRRAGYVTRAVTGGGYLDPTHGFAQGFDRYVHWAGAPDDPGEMEWELDLALGWMRELAGRPFFLFVHTYSIHSPFRIRQPYFDELSPGVEAVEGTIIQRVAEPPGPEEGFVRQTLRFLRQPRPGAEPEPMGIDEIPVVQAAYDSGVAFADHQLGRLLRQLESPALAGRTLTIVTSDHGESLYDDGIAGHGNLREDNLLVPLVVALPGRRRAGGTVARQVRSIDLVPTVLAELGLEPEPGIDGVSLLPLVDGAGGTTGPPPGAFSYASLTNLGLALRLDGKLTYHFNNTAWAPAHGVEGISRRDSGDEGGGGESSERLRQIVTRTLERRASSLRLDISNAEKVPLAGRLLGPMVLESGVKATWLPPRGLRWVEPGVANFEIGPGERFTLYFERGEPRFRIEARLGLAGQTLELDADASQGEWSVFWDGAGWQSAEAGGETGTGFRFWWVGRPQVVERPPAEVDPQLKRRLEALGYVD